MAIRKVVLDGDEMLKKVSRPVEKFDGRLATLVGDMRDTLISQNGVGLAAPQVGVLKRVFVIHTGEEIKEFINPEIISREGEQRTGEGCLSCPGLWGITVRPKKVIGRAFDLKGNEFEFTGEDLMAKAFCHENDHLNGVLFKERVIEWLEKDEKT